MRTLQNSEAAPSSSLIVPFQQNLRKPFTPPAWKSSVASHTSWSWSMVAAHSAF